MDDLKRSYREYDVDYLCEVLDITSEDILYAFIERVVEFDTRGEEEEEDES